METLPGRHIFSVLGNKVIFAQRKGVSNETSDFVVNDIFEISGDITPHDIIATLDEEGVEYSDGRKFSKACLQVGQSNAGATLFRRFDTGLLDYTGIAPAGKERATSDKVYSNGTGESESNRSVSGVVRSSSYTNNTNIKDNKLYSAKQSELAETLVNEYGYTAVSANRILKSVSALKRNSGSNADMHFFTSLVTQNRSLFLCFK